MNKQHIKELICGAKRGKKEIVKKLNRAQKCSILGPQNLGSGGGPGPRGPPNGSAPAVSSTMYMYKGPSTPRETGTFLLFLLSEWAVVER